MKRQFARATPFIVCASFFIGCTLLAQYSVFEVTLRFENEQTKKPINGWGGGPSETLHFDSEIVYEGTGAARIKRDLTSKGTFSALTKVVDLDFEGEWIELRGYLKTEGVTEYASLWMREDDTSGMLQFGNLRNRSPKGTTDWKEYTLRLPLDRNARKLFFGVTLSGTGKVWADNLQLLIDGKPIDEAPKRMVEPTILDTDQQFANGSDISLSQLTRIQVNHLALLGRVWGFLKYHHPQIAAGKLHWDFELFRILPEVLDAPDRHSLQRVLSHWILSIGQLEPCAPCAQIPDDLHLHSEVDWIRDTALLGSGLSDQLQEIYENRFHGEEPFYVSTVAGVGNPVFKNEPDYHGKLLPDAGFRILALFRLWNIIEYWFPYRNLLEDDWEELLNQYLPRFVSVDNADDYKLQLLSLISRIHDGHANLWSSLDVRPPRGDCYLPFEVRFIENKPVIVKVFDDSIESKTGLMVGDVLEAIDEIPLEELIQKWAPYYAASNEATRMRDIAGYLPRGDCEPRKVTILRQGQSATITLEPIPANNRKPMPVDRPGETFQLLSPDVAYVKLSSIRNRDIKSYLEQASDTKGLVIDIRNYPSEFVVFSLGSHLIEEATPFARFTVTDLSNPGTFTWTDPLVLQPKTPTYNGKIAILVNEISQSQAEYTSMAFRAGPRAIVAGSQTAGADGNVSRIPLPGGLQTMISGIGVFYPDKTPTQRIGIVPDIRVSPTIEGVRTGRDEVLEAALKHILGNETDAETIQRLAARTN